MDSATLYSHLALDIKCQHCSQRSVQSLSEIIAQNGITCLACHYIAPFVPADWNALSFEMMEAARTIKDTRLKRRTHSAAALLDPVD